MIKDMTIGQYYPSNSIIHGLDPRVKLFATMIYIASLFIIKELWLYIPIGLLVILIIYCAKIPFKHIIKGVKPIIFLLLLTLIFNIVFSSGDVFI